MDLGIVPQRLIMTDTLCLAGYSLFVYYAALFKLCFYAEPFVYNPPEHLKLNTAHKFNADLPQMRIPHNIELSFLLAEFFQHHQRSTVACVVKNFHSV